MTKVPQEVVDMIRKEIKDINNFLDNMHDLQSDLDYRILAERGIIQETLKLNVIKSWALENGINID
jgi:hypothetical protein